MDSLLESLPSELIEKVTAFDNSLGEFENVLTSLLSVPRTDTYSKLTPLDQAKLDLTSAYSINSLFWMYLNVRGENPKAHGVKQELDRIRTYMNQVKEIEDKKKAPKLDKAAAKRFVKSSLWQRAHTKEKTDGSENLAKESTDTSNHTNNEQTPRGKKHKKRKQKDSSGHKFTDNKKGRYMNP